MQSRHICTYVWLCINLPVSLGVCGWVSHNRSSLPIEALAICQSEQRLACQDTSSNAPHGPWQRPSTIDHRPTIRWPTHSTPFVGQTDTATNNKNNNEYKRSRQDEAKQLYMQVGPRGVESNWRYKNVCNLPQSLPQHEHVLGEKMWLLIFRVNLY